MLISIAQPVVLALAADVHVRKVHVVLVVVRRVKLHLRKVQALTLHDSHRICPQWHRHGRRTLNVCHLVVYVADYKTHDEQLNKSKRGEIRCDETSRASCWQSRRPARADLEHRVGCSAAPDPQIPCRAGSLNTNQSSSTNTCRSC